MRRLLVPTAAVASSHQGALGTERARVGREPFAGTVGGITRSRDVVDDSFLPRLARLRSRLVFRRSARLGARPGRAARHIVRHTHAPPASATLW